jgi:DNA-binding beta-propeller fold protein YncE
MKSPIATLAFAGALACLFGGAVQAHSPNRAGASATVSAHRVIVADAVEPIIRVIDLDTGRTLATHRLASPARLARGASGRYVYAVQATAGRIAVLDGGIELTSHGDHDDISVNRPRLLETTLRGERPVHFNRGNGFVAAFFDGTGSARVVPEADLVRGRARAGFELTSTRAHHGVAKPVTATRVAMSVPLTEGQTLPDAIELRDAAGAASDRIACPRLHGEAATGPFTVFGCADGVAVYEAGRAGVAARHIPYPNTLPPGRMVRNGVGGDHFRFVVADFGADGMVVLDPSVPTGDFRFVQLPARRMAFDLVREPGHAAAVLLEDGRLLELDAMSGEIRRTAQVTDRYAMEQGVTRPRVTSAGRHVVVSNPAKGEIVVLSAETFAETRRIQVGGVPFDVLAIGGTGTRH